MGAYDCHLQRKTQQSVCLKQMQRTICICKRFTGLKQDKIIINRNETHKIAIEVKYNDVLNAKLRAPSIRNLYFFKS